MGKYSLLYYLYSDQNTLISAAANWLHMLIKLQFSSSPVQDESITRLIPLEQETAIDESKFRWSLLYLPNFDRSTASLRAVMDLALCMAIALSTALLNKPFELIIARCLW